MIYISFGDRARSCGGIHKSLQCFCCWWTWWKRPTWEKLGAKRWRCRTQFTSTRFASDTSDHRSVRRRRWLPIPWAVSLFTTRISCASRTYRRTWWTSCGPSFNAPGHAGFNRRNATRSRTSLNSGDSRGGRLPWTTTMEKGKNSTMWLNQVAYTHNHCCRRHPIPTSMLARLTSINLYPTRTRRRSDVSERQGPASSNLASHLFLHFNVGWEFYMVVQYFKTFNELSNTIRPKTKLPSSSVTNPGLYLVTTSLSLSSSCVSSDFLLEHFTRTLDILLCTRIREATIWNVGQRSVCASGLLHSS